MLAASEDIHGDDPQTSCGPALAGVWGLVLGYILTAPIGCTTSSSLPSDGVLVAEGFTRCNGVSFDYAGGGLYSPPLLPALLVGLIVVVVSAAVVRTVLARRVRAGARGRCRLIAMCGLAFRSRRIASSP